MAISCVPFYKELIMVIIVVWFLLALVFVALGQVMQNNVITGIGAVALLSMAMIADVSW